MLSQVSWCHSETAEQVCAEMEWWAGKSIVGTLTARLYATRFCLPNPVVELTAGICLFEGAQDLKTWNDKTKANVSEICQLNPYRQEQDKEAAREADNKLRAWAAIFRTLVTSILSLASFLNGGSGEVRYGPHGPYGPF